MRSSFEPRPYLERAEFVPSRPPDEAPEPSAEEAAEQQASEQAYARGRADARGELEAELRAGLADALHALESCAQDLRAVHAQERAALATSVVELALAIAGRIVSAELRENAEALAPRVEEALGLLPPDDAIVLELSTADAERVLAGELPELERLRTQWSAEIVGEASLGPGEARLRSGPATVDLRVAALLERFRAALDETLPLPEVSA